MSESETIAIDVNGAPRECAAGLTVRGLIEELGLGDRRVAVERNLTVVLRDEYDDTVITEGDRIEIVSLVGGG